MPRWMLVGREVELVALAAARRGARLVYVHGAGGVGKSTLLKAFAATCEHVRIDGRDIECVPSALLRSLAAALGDADADPIALLRSREPCVVMIDSYEQLSDLDRWVRETMLPTLPATTLLVLAGRNAPSPEWRGESDWGASLRALAVKNLTPENARELLVSRGVPPRLHAAALGFTHGHPLAVCLVADLIARNPDATFAPKATPEIVQALLSRFVKSIDDESQQVALDACSVLRATNESLLGALLGVADARALFRWLSNLSFIELGPDGLFPHDIAREALFQDLKWRNPERLGQLMERASAFLAAQLRERTGREGLRLANDLLYIHSHHPVIGSFTPWRGAAGVVIDTAGAADRAGIVDIVARHEGRTSAVIAARWLDRDPRDAVIVRDAGSAPAGVALNIRLDRVKQADLAGDPIAQQAARYVAERRKPGVTEAVLLTRFLMTRDAYQDHSPIQSILGSQSMRLYLTTPELGWTFTCMADPERWQELLAAAFGARLLPPIEVDGRRYGLFWHCFRDHTPTAWLGWLARRGAVDDPGAPIPKPLDREQVQAAVKAALRDLHHGPALADNPLVGTGLCRGSRDSASALQMLLRDAAESIMSARRGPKIWAALHHTYFSPAATQEEASERAGLAFGTYRRCLADGIDQIAETLWRRQRGS